LWVMHVDSHHVALYVIKVRGIDLRPFSEKVKRRIYNLSPRTI